MVKIEIFIYWQINGGSMAICNSSVIQVSTATQFGRNGKELEALVEMLARSGQPKHDALLIGAGWHDYVNCSYEPFELAAALKRAGKPWALTVMDYNPAVCEGLRNQDTLVINNFLLHLYCGSTGYAERFFAAVDADVSEWFYARSEHKVEVKIPPAMRERISVVQGDLTRPETFPRGPYNVVASFNTLFYLDDPVKKKVAVDTLSSKMAEGGIVLSDFMVDGFEVFNTITAMKRTDRQAPHDAYVLRKPMSPAAKLNHSIIQR